MRNFDVIVIGAGPGGYECATLLAENGKKVALIEKNEIGGTCLNEGCVPAKQYLESATYLAKQAYMQSCGVNVQDLSLDMNTLKTKKDTLITQLQSGISAKLKKAKVELIFGDAKFENNNSIKVNDEILSAEKFVIATGSIHRAHPTLEVDKKLILSSKEIFELEKIPKDILIVGAGAIGCEFATFFNALGVNVVMAEFTPTIVPNEDEDVAKALKRELEKKGIKIYVNTNVSSFQKHDNHIEITMQTPKEQISQNYDFVLVSIGRAPNTQDLCLEKADITSERGFVNVDKHLLTNNLNVYALGDVIATPALAHMAYHEAKVVCTNICDNDKITSSHIVPFVTFCQPQVASVGKNEKTLKKENISYIVKKIFYKSSAKAKIKGDDSGFIKLLVEKDTNVILGASMIGNDATELIHQVLIAINANLTCKKLADMIFAHPTLSESLWQMLN